MPYSGGLTRNIVQCLNDFDIPLKLSHTVAKIHGTDRVTGVTIAKVDKNLRVIPEESEYIPCDTLLLSCGLLPENELTQAAGIGLDGITGGASVNQNRETSMSGVFSAGNVLHVHDLVDYVSEEAELAGKSAAKFVAKGGMAPKKSIHVGKAGGVRYTVPQRLDIYGENDDVKIYFRVGAVMENVTLVVKANGEIVSKQKKRKMAPGEMEYATVKKDVLDKAPDSVSVEIISEEA